MSVSQVRDLFNRPMHDLRISVIDSCNFRCPYCMPSEIFGEDYLFLKQEELLSFDEITRLTRLIAKLGVTKVKITGGEPLLRPWLPELVRMLTAVEEIDEVALITNGSLLEKMARALRSAGLTRVTVSLDSLVEETFQILNGRRHRLGSVLSGIDAALAAGFSSIKLNVVVIRGVNDGDLLDIVRRFRGRGCIVRFIEFMDVGNRNGWTFERVVPSREILERIEALYPLEPVAPNYRGEVASRYRYKDGGGEIGFISSVSEPFCRDCSRIRLSAEGRLYTCLFGRQGYDVRTPMRAGATDVELTDLVTKLWKARQDRYSEERSERGPVKEKKVEMYHIGG